ncbi:DUF29 domain-containing protein [Synechococcus sp. PCC 6717]|jgi:hypothetical protein|uniref:DUF29 domain-containing protein n=1 Tax=Parathermosynechococcus lividus PCC 6715 TaxID=1917166 RepID=A0A2D2Q1Z2_PARLV|nr:DUF29 domain-containing protein [Thermostichus lividus]ATS18525.1 hypothetical protein BRW62_06890 [Thermostichus lividus PCC 6715]MCI3280662.1 DUF29 domain-containing protein [Synechococcus sp. PCC 6717]
MSQTPNLSSLYDQDILLWSEDTVAKLKARDFDHLDIEHLIEEVEALGISQKKELISRLIVLLEHLLKRLYVNLPGDYNGWERTIRTQRSELEVLLDTAPSLSNRWELSFDKAWQIALKNVRKEYPQVSFPDAWSYDRAIEQLLNNDFWLQSTEEN